jgi:hypothetical protein
VAAVNADGHYFVLNIKRTRKELSALKKRGFFFLIRNSKEKNLLFTTSSSASPEIIRELRSNAALGFLSNSIIAAEMTPVCFTADSTASDAGVKGQAINVNAVA